MENKMTDLEKAEVVMHMQEFTSTIAEALREFVRPLDPTEGEREMEYIRNVMRAADNLILAALMRQDDKQAVDMMEKSSDMMMQDLIDYHNKDREIH